MKRTFLEIWCWYLAAILAILDLLQDSLPVWARVALAIAVLWQTRIIQLDDRRRNRPAGGWR